jgi:RimJ/RimL family protein N-acetyltransferase
MPILQIPQLTTDRLLLRGFSPGDFERYAEMMADPEVWRHLMDGRPLTRVEAWRQLAMFTGH